MAAVRIAAVFLAALLPIAGAQQSLGTFLTVQVTDPTGAPVPGAQVDVTLFCKGPTGGETDGQGRITLTLEPNPWRAPAPEPKLDVLTIASPGFCPERRMTSALSQPKQTIPVTLQEGGCPSKCTWGCAAVEPSEPMPPTQGHVAVQVIDATGAVIPSARVEVDSSAPTPGPSLRTDGIGRASLDLPAGIHTLSVSRFGFYSWRHQVNVPAGSSRTIIASLEAASMCDPVPIDSSTPDISLDSPESVQIPLQPLESLAPLPSRPTKGQQ